MAKNLETNSIDFVNPYEMTLERAPHRYEGSNAITVRRTIVINDALTPHSLAH